MIKKITLVIFILLVSKITFAGKVTPTIPIEVDSVQTKRIADSLIRIIEYNTELKQSLIIERMKTPEIKVVEKIEITRLMIGNKVLDFKTSAGVYIEDLKIDKGIIIFLVDYFYGGKGAGSIVVKCKVNANNNKLSDPICFKK